ncbi:MAG: threonylcarbamoyl-AMP synthase [Acidobacteriaceae bacterium]|nr:threonylcarbamoyl-AMP synthase [Acidobacteriaceae bacterium]MBV9780472.1 threonylcarbamoyl-AMP synthase [Acidobacteriaceae bacterium]
MATDLIEVDVDNPYAGAIDRAVEEVERGNVVGVPTDALYMLVADPFNLHAVGRVFAAKGRESERSLPLAISDTLMAEDLAKELNSRFYILARHFWPGPLTMIVPAASKVPLKVTGNTGRLAMRQGNANVLNAMVEKTGHALIATSANMSGKPTIASGIELFATMDGRIDLVLDGGLCTGTGSTTVDITEPYWRVIKEGAISEKEIAQRLKAN